MRQPEGKKERNKNLEMEGTKDIFEENDANENWKKSEGLQNK